MKDGTLINELHKMLIEESGGHSLSNLKHEALWSSRAPINLTKIIEIVRNHSEVQEG